jgi:hypothetical protein
MVASRVGVFVDKSVDCMPGVAGKYRRALTSHITAKITKRARDAREQASPPARPAGTLGRGDGLPHTKRGEELSDDDVSRFTT